MKRLILSVQFLLLTAVAFAQTDSLAIVNTRWNVNKISNGVKLRQYNFHKSLFNSNQNISILEVKQRGRGRYFDLAYDPRVLRKTSDFAKEANALAAINGTFFDILNGGSVDYIESDNRVINENRTGANGKRNMHQKAAVLFNSGKLLVMKWNGEQGWEQSLVAEYLMVTGPLLL